MLVLSRQCGEGVMIGDDVLVTVVGIGDASATLDVQTSRNGTIAGGQVSLDRDDVYEIGPMMTVVLLDVRGEKVRLGFQLPSEMSLHRREVHDAVKGGPASAAASLYAGQAVNRTTVLLQVDQVLHLGEKLTASPTDIDATGVRLLVKGELLGGALDGERIHEAKEVGRNSVLSLGALISLSLVGADESGRAMFHVIAPAHVKIWVQ